MRRGLRFLLRHQTRFRHDQRDGKEVKNPVDGDTLSFQELPLSAASLTLVTPLFCVRSNASVTAEHAKAWTPNSAVWCPRFSVFPPPSLITVRKKAASPKLVTPR